MIYNLEYDSKKESERAKEEPSQNTSVSVVLSSPEMNGQACFFFWHSMYGANVETLSAYVAYVGHYDQLGELYFRKSGTQGPRWTETKMNVGIEEEHGTEPYKVRIEGLVDENYVGEMSIDDIRFELGNCFEDADHPWELCSFESLYEIDVCGYTSPDDNQLNWQLKTGAEEGTTDHTLSTSRGHYMAIDTTSEDLNKKAKLVSPFYTPFDEGADAYCLQFYWLAEVFSPNTGGSRFDIRLYEGSIDSHSDVKVAVYPISSTTDKQIVWQIGEAEISPQQDFAMVFDLIIGKNANMSLGIDDIKISPGHCSITNCDFEADWCFWRNIGEDDADFRRYAKQGGSYLYIDETAVTDVSKPFTYARIRSQTFPNTMQDHDVCMSFYYYMENWENSTERFSVAISGRGYERTIWEVNGIPEPQWTQAFVPISFPNALYSIILEAGIRSGAPGTVAVDDIVFLSDSCDIQPSNALPYEYSEQKIDCSFDKDLCEYTSSSEDEARFEIVDKRPTTANSGPDQGQSGSFLFFDSIKYENKSISLYSVPAAPPPHGFCVSFYYDMFGTEHQGILLYMEKMQSKTHVGTHDGDSSLLWARQGSQVDRWERQEVNVPGPDAESNWRLRFFMASHNNFGDIALDTIDLKRGPCEHKHDCDFELGTMCRWQNITGPDPGNVTTNLHWSIVRGVDMLDNNYFPIFDHSAGSYEGSYLTVDMGPGAGVMEVARFASQKFGENSGTMCLSFYWVFLGNAEVEFNLHSYKSDPLTEGGILFGQVFNLDNSDWRFAQVEITETDAFEVDIRWI